MKRSDTISEMRATIFVSPIVYDPQNLQRVMNILTAEDGYMPNVSTQQILPPGFPVHIQQNGIPVEWEMISRSTKLKVHFGPQKIDIIQTEIVPSDNAEADFCERCTGIFISLIERFELTPTRLAYAPTYNIIFDKEFSRNAFIEKIYSAREFSGSKLNTILFKHGYVINERLNERDFQVNYVADASEGHNIEEIHDQGGHTVSINIKNVLNISLDINTRQGLGYTFSKKELECYFKAAPSMANKFSNYYGIN